jgi:hypothetical protein
MARHERVPYADPAGAVEKLIGAAGYGKARVPILCIDETCAVGVTVDAWFRRPCTNNRYSQTTPP